MSKRYRTRGVITGEKSVKGRTINKRGRKIHGNPALNGQSNPMQKQNVSTSSVVHDVHSIGRRLKGVSSGSGARIPLMNADHNKVFDVQYYNVLFNFKDAINSASPGNVPAMTVLNGMQYNPGQTSSAKLNQDLVILGWAGEDRKWNSNALNDIHLSCYHSGSFSVVNTGIDTLRAGDMFTYKIPEFSPNNEDPTKKAPGKEWAEQNKNKHNEKDPKIAPRLTKVDVDFVCTSLKNIHDDLIIKLDKREEEATSTRPSTVNKMFPFPKILNTDDNRREDIHAEPRDRLASAIATQTMLNAFLGLMTLVETDMIKPKDSRMDWSTGTRREKQNKIRRFYIMAAKQFGLLEMDKINVPENSRRLRDLFNRKYYEFCSNKMKTLINTHYDTFLGGSIEGQKLINVLKRGTEFSEHVIIDSTFSETSKFSGKVTQGAKPNGRLTIDV